MDRALVARRIAESCNGPLVPVFSALTSACLSSSANYEIAPCEFSNFYGVRRRDFGWISAPATVLSTVLLTSSHRVVPSSCGNVLFEDADWHQFLWEITGAPYRHRFSRRWFLTWEPIGKQQDEHLQQKRETERTNGRVCDEDKETWTRTSSTSR
ncbi:hypothetical protein V1478_006681 [Vespula squamosa]|uniref:Uncharacterized protein n=1 Tax=Vespula squamosa TaxID=30214 RepID=A0ABD2B8I6_VESSQ